MQPPIPIPRLEPILCKSPSPRRYKLYHQQDINNSPAPLLATLPAAAVSPQPPTALLPLLSPILRQRVQLLASPGSGPWLSLLCYDASQFLKLDTIAKSEKLEAHPVSGHVEVDWEYDVEVQYKRLDEETLQALVVFQELGLTAKLLWCVGDVEGGGDGWRIGAVSVQEGENTWGSKSIGAAEAEYNVASEKEDAGNEGTPEEDDDDDYWAQYDTTPGTTPAPKLSPAPVGDGNQDEDSYYAQYASVQPAMDNHDPDEDNGVESSLGKDEVASIYGNGSAGLQGGDELHSTSNVWSDADLDSYQQDRGDRTDILEPRPRSSGSDTTVENLERKAEYESNSEVGIKQHIGTTIKSLYRLAKVAGIDRTVSSLCYILSCGSVSTRRNCLN